ncbi:hypothetical protein GCM10007276_08830 [Agaricicola taiwanensis]|uniref:ASCH domain-containing protein n=1 Tax=Agaricicola taiwanensis TaxID=591372 RepID=A0A8J2YG58_9RHOB|nr:hypothetical protein [Agaricicola taiwanensis]GGE33722.1 hypothetical protein GCM10007276_08830 [Agaricicola taiwanensis]
MKVTKALIIADPWIGYILDGSKTWEMRSTGASHRGWFGLIRKGSGAVYAAARLADVGAPLSSAEMIASFDKHRIPEEMIRSGAVEKWNTPWKLADIRRFRKPVPYRHKSGAVTWVHLDEDVSRAIAIELGSEVGTESLSVVTSVSPPKQQKTPSSPILATRVESSKTAGALLGEVKLTAGNIRNSHIYLRDLFDRFPEEAVGGSNRHEKAAREVIVDWGGASPAQTDLDGSKKLFRSRGWIRTFFEANDASAGDRVQVQETGPYSYRVRVKKRGGAR